jgi:hypothetical protein
MKRIDDGTGLVGVRRMPAPEGRDRGMVTAELAMGLPALMLVLLFGLSMLGAVAAEARCAEAARIGARAAARGEADEVVRTWAERAAPPGAVVALRRTDDSVEVRVRAEVGGGERSPLPAIAVEASALTPVEDATTQIAGEQRNGP